MDLLNHRPPTVPGDRSPRSEDLWTTTRPARTGKRAPRPEQYVCHPRRSGERTPPGVPVVVAACLGRRVAGLLVPGESLPVASVIRTSGAAHAVDQRRAVPGCAVRTGAERSTAPPADSAHAEPEIGQEGALPCASATSTCTRSPTARSVPGRATRRPRDHARARGLLRIGRQGVPADRLLPHRWTAHLVDHDTSIAPGVDLVMTPGHTPGHLSVVVSSGVHRRRRPRARRAGARAAVP